MITRSSPAILVLLLISTGCDRGDEIPLAAGVIEATEVIVSSEASGRLLEFDVEEGQELSADTVVGRVDCRQLELQRELLVTRTGGLDTRVADVGTQTGPLSQQIAEAERERKRIATLVESGAAVPKQLDDVDAQIAVLRRQKTAAAQSLSKGNRALDDERAAMEVQLAQLDDQIGRCEIRSPTAGTVLVKYAEQGEFALPGKALFKIADTSTMILRAYVTADQLTQMQLGQQVKVHTDFGAEGNREYDGRISWIATKSEFTPKTIQTRDERANLVYAIKVSVPNDGYLKLGMYGYIPLDEGNGGDSGQ